MKIQQLLRQLKACQRRCRRKLRLPNTARLDMSSNRISLKLTWFNPRLRLPHHIARQRKFSPRQVKHFLSKLRQLFSPDNLQPHGTARGKPLSRGW